MFVCVCGFLTPLHDSLFLIKFRYAKSNIRSQLKSYQ